MTATANGSSTVSREDIESKFRELQGEVDIVTDDVRSYAATVGAVVVVVVVVAAFWVGRRRGARRAPSSRSAGSDPVPGSNRPSPATIGQGLATWAVYVAVRRSTKPVKWAVHQARRALFSWSDYTRFLREQSLVEGVFGGSKLWLVIGGSLWGVRAVRRASARTERIVLSEVIQPGERIVITQIPRKVPRKQRRAAAKAG